jgi:hypothetical protein
MPMTGKIWPFGAPVPDGFFLIAGVPPALSRELGFVADGFWRAQPSCILEWV